MHKFSDGYLGVKVSSTLADVNRVFFLMINPSEFLDGFLGVGIYGQSV